MNKYLITIGIDLDELNHILECVENKKNPKDESMFIKIKNAWKDTAGSPFVEINNTDFRLDQDMPDFRIYFESPDVFEDEIDHEIASELYMLFRDNFVKEKVFREETITGLTFYDKQKGIYWEWQNDDFKQGLFTWFKDDDEGEVDAAFEEFDDLKKLPY